MKTKLHYQLVLDTDAAVFAGKVQHLLGLGWDLSGNLVVTNATTNVDSPDVELTTLFQPMTKVIEIPDDNKNSTIY